MNKRTKRGLVLLLAFVMTISASLSAYAMGTLKESKNVTIEASTKMFGNDMEPTGLLHIYEDGMEVEVTYKGNRYLNLYLGSKEEAEAAFSDKLCGAVYDETTGTYLYTIPVEKDQFGTDIPAAVLSSTGGWKENTLTITQTNPASDEVEISATAKMFKKNLETKAKLVEKDGKTYVEAIYKGNAYFSLYLGTKAEAETACGGNYYPAVVKDGIKTFTIPVKELGKAFSACPLSKTGKWTNNTFTVTLPGSTEEPEKPENPTVPEEPETPTVPSEPETPTVPEQPTVIAADGIYKIAVESSAKMFKVEDCKLTVKKGAMTGAITLSGTGYTKLYLGTAKEAENAAEGSMIGYQTDKDGKYVFEVPVSSLDRPIPVAAYSLKNEKWYDRTLTFQSSTLQLVTGNQGTENNPGTQTPTTGNQGSSSNNKGELTKDEIQNLENNTVKGNIKDGTYTPSFGFTGGTGKTTISCNKVVVKNGKAAATIAFSSSSYTWVKVNGTKYYNENKGGNATFTIPIQLNGKTNITGETTAMSTAHEIDYVLYCYVDGTVVKTSGKDSKDSVIDLTGEDGTDGSTEEDTLLEENGWGVYEETEETSAQPVKVTVNQPSNLPVILLCVLTGILDLYVIGFSIFFFLRWRKNKKGE